MTARALMRPRGRDLADVVFPPVQSDLFVVGLPTWIACTGQHAHWEERLITPTGDRLSDLFAAARDHEEAWHR